MLRFKRILNKAQRLNSQASLWNVKPKTCRACSGLPNGSASNEGCCVQKCLLPASSLWDAHLKAKVNQTEISFRLTVPKLEVVFLLHCSPNVFITSNLTGRYLGWEGSFLPLIVQLLRCRCRNKKRFLAFILLNSQNARWVMQVIFKLSRHLEISHNERVPWMCPVTEHSVLLWCKVAWTDGKEIESLGTEMCWGGGWRGSERRYLLPGQFLALGAIVFNCLQLLLFLLFFSLPVFNSLCFQSSSRECANRFLVCLITCLFWPLKVGFQPKAVCLEGG